MRMTLIAIAVPALLVTSAAAFAQPAVQTYAENQIAPRASDGASGQPNAQPAPERRICVDVQLSGSHMTRRICRTAREWDERGGLETDR